jgi:hypothetical protein
MCYDVTRMKSDAVLNLRVPAALKDALTDAADKNLRTMSSMAVWALTQWLEVNGFLDERRLSDMRPKRRRS